LSPVHSTNLRSSDTPEAVGAEPAQVRPSHCAGGGSQPMARGARRKSFEILIL
jgi:hypothetical protein